MDVVTQDLREIASISDQKQRTEQYKQLLQKQLAEGNVEACNAYVDHSMFRAQRCIHRGDICQ